MKSNNTQYTQASSGLNCVPLGNRWLHNLFQAAKNFTQQVLEKSLNSLVHIYLNIYFVMHTLTFIVAQLYIIYFVFQVISDALTTLLEFIDRMQGVQQSGDNSLNNEQNQPHSTTSSLDVKGLPTPETLCSVLERTRVLLRDNAVAALSVCSIYSLPLS